MFWIKLNWLQLNWNSSIFANKRVRKHTFTPHFGVHSQRHKIIKNASQWNACARCSVQLSRLTECVCVCVRWMNKIAIFQPILTKPNGTNVSKNKWRQSEKRSACVCVCFWITSVLLKWVRFDGQQQYIPARHTHNIHTHTHAQCALLRDYAHTHSVYI